MLRETFQSLFCTLDGAILFGHPVAFRGRREKPLHGELGFAVVIFEGHRHLKLHGLDISAPAMAVDQPFGFHDLFVDDPILVIDAVGAVHDEPPNATWPHVDRANGGGEAMWPPPLHQVFWIGPRFKDELTRRVEPAGGDNRPRIMPGVEAISCVHASSPWLEVS